MNAHRNLQRLSRGGDGGADLVWQPSAVRVAQDNDLGSGVLGRLDRFESEVRVRSEAVEEVFGIVEDSPSLAVQEADGVADHRQVLRLVDAQYLEHVQVPGLADDDTNLRQD